MKFESRFGLLDTVRIRDVPMLIIAVDFLPGGRIRYCLAWLSGGQYADQWIGEDELIKFLEMK